jgi:hypothetical protein
MKNNAIFHPDDYFSLAERSFDKIHCAKKAIAFIEQSEHALFVGISNLKRSLVI